MDLPDGKRSRTSSIVPVVSARPTVADLHGENPFAQVARDNWTNSQGPPKIRQTVVKDDLWDPLERDGFPYMTLLILENLQLLEKYLWPGYDEESTDHHVLLMALMVNVKTRENLPIWSRCIELLVMKYAQLIYPQNSLQRSHLSSLHSFDACYL
jgi:intron-binding protein aquarius